MATWSWQVQSSAQARADRFILDAIESGQGNWEGEPVACSRSQLQRLIELGAVQVDGETIKARTLIENGSRVVIAFPKAANSEVLAEDLPLDILFQDEHLVVLNKPQGLTVHPSTTQADGTLVNALLHHVRDLSGVGGVLRPGIVHRIDKDTSGVMVVSKTDVAHRKLVETFAKHAIDRKYWALCYGAPREAESRIESLIGRNPMDRKKMSMTVKEGRKAVTHTRRIEEYGTAGKYPFASWIEATLETGRTHQIRVHLTGTGYSVLGDPAYGNPSERQTKWVALPKDIQELVSQLPGQALHARVLGFEHPVTGQKLHFEAEPPEAFRRLLAGLQRYR